MMKLVRTSLLCAAMCAPGIASAVPVVIDFDSNVFVNTSVDNLLSNPYEEDGFRITTQGRPLSVAGTLSTDFLGTPSAHLRITDGAIDLEIAAVGGGQFDLLSIDLSILNPNGVSPLVTFEAFDELSALVGTQSFQPTIFGLQTVNFGSAFQGVSRVRWRQGTGETNAHQFDNIVVQAVPAPVTLALLALGVTAVGLRRGRRSRA